MRTSRRSATIAVTAAVVATLGVGPASAEGGFSASISAWLPGKDSRQWTDNNRDNDPTTVGFAGCSVDTGRFIYAGLQLKLNRASLPDPVLARDDNHCNVTSFGDRSAGTYYFHYSNLNGATGVAAHLTVNTVVVKY
ncbi:hypothetical protein [Streptomyces sp. SP18CS02]|uniref:hypothetical protein n=1 Tax=Streptomyces sp. SP18CS02 TaxID=3002531 RepID=UPI002E773A7C|nr:hypothetical protein [Streptomyces sp. SP18CS02]MEE1753011.1 hypothetical protein [Streptomyces sp. SP18CS02]